MQLQIKPLQSRMACERQQNYARSGQIGSSVTLVGSTVYEVSVYFKDGCRETSEDKIFRIVSNQGLKTAPKCAIIKELQTERLSGGANFRYPGK